MKFNILKQDGTKGSSITVDDSVFAIEPNNGVVHQAVVTELANGRQGTHSTKNRSGVRGGDKKPWKQKGRGVARAGTIRSPIWKGGGVAFGPEPHKYYKKISKKMRQLARRSVLSSKSKNGEIIILEDISISAPKTKDFTEILKKLNLSGKKITILVAGYSDDLFLAVRNIPNIYLVEATSASTYDILDCETLLFDKAGLSLINNQLTVN